MSASAASRTEELRLALVMNGGVSLAVWMGGVTNEIFRLVNDRHPVYTQLLDLTGTAARVDVISGTSAGGINGAALSVAMIYGGDFSRLRDVWLNTGSFTDLLRSPMEDNPGSLLQGEEFFLPNIEDALRSLIPPSPVLSDAELGPVELRLTTTLLTGCQGNNVDDLGSRLNDVDYRAQFHFRHRHGRSDFDQRGDVVAMLARAARSTASFPFAFEPSLLTKDNGGSHLRTASDDAPVLPRYVVDGGVLDNKPFAGAREAIFSMPTQRSVRRVLAYVNPDPGNGPAGTPGGPMPSLAHVLVEGLLSIPQSQTIADQLAAVEEHNDSIRAKKESVTTLASLGAPVLDALPGELYRVYHRRRLSSTFERFVYEALSDAARRKPEYARGLRALGKSGREQLKLAFIDNSGTGWLPPKWPARTSDAERAVRADPAKDAEEDRYIDDVFSRDTWGWGLYPVEFGAKVTLDMLRMTQKLADECTVSPLPAPDPRPSHAPARHDDWSDGDWQHDPGRPAEAAPETLAYRLAALWTSINKVTGETLKVRADEEREHWIDATEILLKALSERLNDDLLSKPLSVAWCGGQFDRMFSFLGDPDRRRRCAAIAYELAAIIPPLIVIAREQLNLAAERYATLRRRDIDLTKRLVDLVTFFEPAKSDPTRILYAIMQLEVVEFAFNDHESLSTTANIELVQISGNSASPLGGKSEARDKLLGLQLAHFGAFYRRSWRANDWLYGRLDGSERLVRIVLDPERLQRRCGSDIDLAFRHIRSIAVDSVASPRLRQKLDELWIAERFDELVPRELAYMQDPEQPLPDALLHCAKAITQRLHLGILADELPQLIDAIHRDQADGSSRHGGSEAIVRDLGNQPPDAGGVQFTPDQARMWLRNGLLADETLLGQAGSDLFTSTLAHTAATLQGTFASKQASLGPITALFAAVKLPVLGFYFASKGLLGQSRTSAALNGAVLALGTLLVLLQFFWSPADLKTQSLPHALNAIGWALLAYGSLVSMLRGPWTVVALGVVALGIVSLEQSSDLPVRQVVGVSAMLLLVVLSTRFEWLQRTTGFLVIAIAALWGSGWLDPGNDPSAVRFDVLLLAIVVMIALLVAVIQASGLPRWLKAEFGWIYATGRAQVVRRDYRGMVLEIRSRPWRHARIADITIVRVSPGGPGSRVDLRVRDEILAIGDVDVRGLAFTTLDGVLQTPSHGPRCVIRARGPGERPHDVLL